MDSLVYYNQQKPDAERTVNDLVVIVDGERSYGRLTFTLADGTVEDDWIFHCRKWVRNVTPPRVYKQPPNYEFV